MTRKTPLDRMKMEDLLKIGALFKALRWPIDDTIISTFPLLFTRFCRMWGRLRPKQRELIMEITSSFAWIRNDEYSSRFERVWQHLMAVIPKSTRILEITNLPRDGEEGAVKSSDTMLYLARSYLSMMRAFGINAVIRTPNGACRGGRDSALVLLDDYIGTGSTVETALSILQKVAHSAPWGQIYVLAIAAQREAVSRLSACGFTVVVDEICERGISDCLRIKNIDSAIRVMSELGESLGIQQRDWLGYSGTEALIALMRTPNNTFPVFWTNNKVAGRVWDAPFPRYTDSEEQDFEAGEFVEQAEMPACKVGERYTIEALKVLKCISGGHPVDALVEWQIPYSRVLHYLYSLLDLGQIEILESRLRLTSAGYDTLRRPPHKRKGCKREFGNEDLINSGEKRLHIPESPVE